MNINDLHKIDDELVDTIFGSMFVHRVLRTNKHTRAHIGPNGELIDLTDLDSMRAAPDKETP